MNTLLKLATPVRTPVGFYECKDGLCFYPSNMGCRYDSLHGELLLTEELKGVLRNLKKFVPKHDIRYYLNGVHMDSAEGRLVASDGLRLLLCSVEHEVTRSTIIPTSFIRTLLKLDIWGGRTTVGFGENRLTVRLPDGTLEQPHIDGKYPDIDRVLPQVDAQRMLIIDKHSRKRFKAMFAAAKLKDRAFKKSPRVFFDDHGITFRADRITIACPTAGRFGLDINPKHLLDFPAGGTFFPNASPIAAVTYVQGRYLGCVMPLLTKKEKADDYG